MQTELSNGDVDALSNILSKITGKGHQSLSVGELFQAYLNDHAKPNLKTWRNLERCFNSYFTEFRETV